MQARPILDALFYRQGFIIKFVLSGVAIAAFSNLLTHELFSWNELKQRLFNPWALTILLGTVVSVICLITLFTFLLRLRSGRNLPITVSFGQAFAHALDKSSFNPHRLRDNADEQLTSNSIRKDY